MIAWCGTASAASRSGFRRLFQTPVASAIPLKCSKLDSQTSASAVPFTSVALSNWRACVAERAADGVGIPRKNRRQVFRRLQNREGIGSFGCFPREKPGFGL
jgi:hypothetical protein